MVDGATFATRMPQPRVPGYTANPDDRAPPRRPRRTAGHDRIFVRGGPAGVQILPRYAVTLGHDVAANIDVLSKIVTSV